MKKIIKSEYKQKCKGCGGVWRDAEGFCFHHCQQFLEHEGLVEIDWDGESNEYFDSGGKFWGVEFKKMKFAQDRFGEWWRYQEVELDIDSFVEIVNHQLDAANRRRRSRLGDFSSAMEFISNNWEDVNKNNWEWVFQSMGDEVCGGRSTCYFMVNINGEVWFDIKEGPSDNCSVGRTWKSLQPWRQIISPGMREKLVGWTKHFGIKLSAELVGCIDRSLE